MTTPWKREEIIGPCRLLLGDCLDIMPALGRFDAVVTDPPYGIGADKNRRANKQPGRALAPSRDYGDGHCWDDVAPNINWVATFGCPAVVWGGNYFGLPPSSCWLVWDKENGDNGYADCELAWTNLPKAVRRLRWMWHGMLRKGREERYHPTQKPLGVIEWCIGHLPGAAEHILDPFMGSGTTGVACVKLGRRFTGIEIDPVYFDVACDRIRKAVAQPDMFIKTPDAQPVQEVLFDG